MARQKQPPPPDEDPGAPEWMVTFSDCMTLLLTFFVLLLTFSSFDEREFSRLRVIYSDAFSTIHRRVRSSKEAAIKQQQIEYVEDLDRGSEKPTFEDGAEGILEHTDVPDFQRHKVFLATSQNVFWAKGHAISKTGRETLGAFADFAKGMPGKIVVSENTAAADNQQLSMDRAWAVVEYLSKKHQLNKDRFSISAGSTTGHKGFEIFNLDDATGEGQGVLEIVLLDRNI